MPWRAIAETTFNMLQLDEELLVYHIPSGNTHLLGKDAANILLELQKDCHDAASLAQLIAAAHAVPADEGLLQDTESLLEELQSLALIEPA